MWQLRQEFDSGASVHLTSDHSVHDVASLLKEYLRDLADPLLTHELFPAFLASAGTDQLQHPVSLFVVIIVVLCCNWKIRSVISSDGIKFNPFFHCRGTVETIIPFISKVTLIILISYIVFNGTAFGTISDQDGQ